MVRFLLLSCFFLSSAAHAHNAGFAERLTCEQKLGSSIPVQAEGLKYLKKLQSEVDNEFPAESFNRVVVGRALAPLMAGWPHISQVPADTNAPLGKEELWNLFVRHLPSPAMKKRPTVVLLYAESAVQVGWFSRSLDTYLREHNINIANVQFRIFTSQMYLREMRSALPENFSFRPIGHSNEVRHWFSNGLNGFEVVL